MTGIQQELAQLQAEFVLLIDRWNALNPQDRATAWEDYTVSLDEGSSGRHPFSRLLITAWCDGWSAVEGVLLDQSGSLHPAAKLAA